MAAKKKPGSPLHQGRPTPRRVYVQIGNLDPEDQPGFPTGVTMLEDEAMDWAREGYAVFEYELKKVMPLAYKPKKEEDDEGEEPGAAPGG